MELSEYTTDRDTHADSTPSDTAAIVKKMSRTQVNLKLIPNADGTLGIAQLVAYNLTKITVKGAWTRPARLHLVPHVNAPVADLPVKKVLGGSHFVLDLTLPYGRVLYDYLDAGASSHASNDITGMIVADRAPAASSVLESP